MSGRRRRRWRTGELPHLGVDRLHIFVPAIMSVGLVFWIVTLTRDLLRWQGAQAEQRRARAAGRATAAFVLGELGPPAPAMPGLRLRVSYLLTAAVTGTVSLYVLIGSVANYLREGGYVGDIAWLMALSLVVVAVFGAIAGISLTVFLAWPNPPASLHGILRATPLTGATDPDELAGARPSWGLSTAANLVPVVALVFTIMVGSGRSALVQLDATVWEWAEGQAWMDALGAWDPWRSWPALVAVLFLAGLAALRCRVLAVSVPVGLVAGVAAVALAAVVVDRPAPGVAGAAVGISSYPSSRVALAVFLVGVVPLLAAALHGRTWYVAGLRALGTVVVAAVVLSGLHLGSIWLTDAIGGLLFGLAGALVVDWAVAHQRWHDHCPGCAWAPAGSRVPLLSAIHLHPSGLRWVRTLAHLTAGLAAVGLALLALVGGVPANPDGSLLDAQIQRPLQLGLATVVSVGALVTWRWPGVGAVMIAVAAVGLGAFAGLEYRPELAVLMTVALMVPAVLSWLSWQHRRRRGEIVALAAVTLLLVVVAWFGAQEVYGHYFGPTHPDSSADQLAVDRVEWMWSGALTSRGVTVVAGVVPGAREATVRMEPVGGGPAVTGPTVEVSPESIARVEVRGLEPEADYRYVVIVDGVADRSRGVGSLRTPAEGPMSFRVALSGCARSGSNGAVYDAIAATDPLLYLAVGDLHYANLDSDDPAVFRAALRRQLVQPGQAALYRDVPIGYIWDDHDYGPNNAGAESPTRSAARTAYRQMVPHYPLTEPGDAPIQQAFTIGRVRFVMTDTRSERTSSSMLGAAQEEWLVDELTRASRTHAVVVWVNAVPWVGAADPVSDTWAGWSDDRRRIADAISDAGVDNLVMLSGDAHMVAVDDGTNTDYSTARTGGFPLLHAAALDRPGGVKGGPYSEGTFPGGGQFATMDIADDGASVVVTFTGRTWEGEELVRYQFGVDAPAA